MAIVGVTCSSHLSFSLLPESLTFYDPKPDGFTVSCDQWCLLSVSTKLRGPHIEISRMSLWLWAERHRLFFFKFYMAYWYLYLFSSRRKQKLAQSVISKPECEYRMYHFILNTESVSTKLHLSMFSKHRVVFPHYDHIVPLQNLKPGSKCLSLRSFAHTKRATLKGTSLLSTEGIMQPKNSPWSRKETKEQLPFTGNLKKSTCKFCSNT